MLNVAIRQLLFIVVLLLMTSCATMDVDAFRRATREATELASIDPAAPVAGLPVDSVRTLRGLERIIIYYTDSTLTSIEGGLYRLDDGLPPCDAACQDSISIIIQSKLDGHSPVRFWRGTTLAQVRSLKQDRLQIILDTRSGVYERRSVPLWRVDALYVIGRNTHFTYETPDWLVFALGLGTGGLVLVGLFFGWLISGGLE